MTAKSFVITWLFAVFSFCRILHEKQKFSVIIWNGESMISEKSMTLNVSLVSKVLEESLLIKSQALFEKFL